MIWRAVTILTSGVVGSMLGFWTTDREPPTRIMRAEVITKTVPPGGELRIAYTVQRVRSCPTHVDRVLYDSESVRTDLQDIDFAASPGPLGYSNYILIVPIPRNFAQGRGHYKTIASYVCNPLQRVLSPVVVPGDDIEFTVAGEPIKDENGPVEVIPRR